MKSKCNECGGKTAPHSATFDNPYHYTESGLQNVYLVGIEVESCPKCEIEYPTIPRIVDLHRTIAETLAKKPTVLDGSELRFLRKVAGFPANKFAALLRIEPETLSRAEHGDGLGAPSDKLARVVALAAINAESVKTILLEIAGQMESARLRTQDSIFRCDKNRWSVAA